MAPKQVQISELGAPAKNGNGWRAQAKIDGIVVFGPQRDTKKKAWADVALARQSTSREAYARCLQEMRAAVKKEKPVKEEPVDGFPGDPAPQASTASSSVSTHASVPAEVVETRSAATDTKRSGKRTPGTEQDPEPDQDSASASDAKCARTHLPEQKERKKFVKHGPAEQEAAEPLADVETPNAAAHPKPAARGSAASSSAAMDAEKPAEVVETRSAGTGVAAADVSMAEESFHSADEDGSPDDPAPQASLSDWSLSDWSCVGSDGSAVLPQLDEASVRRDYDLDALDPTQRAFADRVLRWVAEVVRVYKEVRDTGVQQDVPLLRSWLGGSAGSGKSTTLRTIVQHARLAFQQEQVDATIQLTAYTGRVSLREVLRSRGVGVFGVLPGLSR